MRQLVDHLDPNDILLTDRYPLNASPLGVQLLGRQFG